MGKRVPLIVNAPSALELVIEQVRRERAARKPTVPEVLPIVQALYQRHAGGCCWHVVLDDGNTERCTVMWVVKDWLPKEWCGNPECGQLAELLPRMSVTQVTKLSSHPEKRSAPPLAQSSDGEPK